MEAAEAVVVAAWPVTSGVICLRARRQLPWQQGTINGEIGGKELMLQRGLFFSDRAFVVLSVLARRKDVIASLSPGWDASVGRLRRVAQVGTRGYVRATPA